MPNKYGNNECSPRPKQMTDRTDAKKYVGGQLAEAYAEGFKAGAEKMREVAAKWHDDQADIGEGLVQSINNENENTKSFYKEVIHAHRTDAKNIRALPIPEDKP